MSGAIKRQTTNFGFNIINYDFPRWHTFEWQNWDVVDAVLAAAGLTSVRGVWANSTQYIIGDRVIDDTDNTIWLCGVNHTSAASGTFFEDRTANPTYWSVISTLPVNRGMWLTAVNYSTQDIVRFGNAYYFCIAAHLSDVFADDLAADKWVLIFDLQDAIDAEAGAIASAAAAATSATDADNSATAAENSATASSSSASDASTSASNAATSETNAAASALQAANVVSDSVIGAVRTDIVQSHTNAQQFQGIQNLGDWLWYNNCYLRKVGANLVLSPKNGNLLFIHGQPEQIPSVGVTLAATGLTPGTVYYIYAYMNAGVMTLEASTTAFGIGSIVPFIGWPIKNGDSTRTIVGLWECTTGPAWATDDATYIGGVSYFNRRKKTAYKNFNANRSVSAGAGAVEVNTEIRVSYVTWADSVIDVYAQGGWTVSGVATANSQIRQDGVYLAPSFSAVSSNTTVSLFLRAESYVTVGKHYATIFAECIGGTSVTFLGGANGQVQLSVTVEG